MVKRLSLVRKATTVDASQFANRWRDDALSQYASTPAALRPIRLAHCVTRLSRHPPLADGVAIAWFRDYDSMVASDQHAAAPCHQCAAPAIDRSTVQSVVVEERCVFGAEKHRSLWRSPVGATALLLIGLLQRAPQLSRPEFRDYWWSQHRPLANRLFPPELQPPIYLHNYTLPHEASTWDGIGELYESSLDTARRRNNWMNSDAAAAIVADETQFMNRATRAILITDFEVLVSDLRS
jgi:hypothetical protein